MPTFDLWEHKLHTPTERAGIVPRTTLVERLLDIDRRAVISVVAPAGYGKTTLLAQWAGRRGPWTAWISVDDRDNDPAVLATYIGEALDRIERIDPAVLGTLASTAPTDVAPRLHAAIAAMHHPIVMVIDNFEAITNLECMDMVAALALDLPGDSQLAIGSRRALALPTARLRSRGGIVEIGLDELAMAGDEAAALLAGAGVELDAADVHELVRRTEGWPAAMYLAALAVTAGGDPPDDRFAGDDRFTADYLRSEILDRLAPSEVSFLTHTAVLERMSGPLCDAVVGTTGSADVLEGLAARNLLVIPLDRRRQWYRYHHLFRDLLLSELRRREPGAIADLHARAAGWCETNGQAEAAVDHAQAAGDADTVARLALQLANPVWASGRSDTVLRWMEWFEADGRVERFPGLAAHGALMFALSGRPGATERWAAAAEAGTATGTLPDGNTVDSTLAYLRALLCRHGPAAMRDDAHAALAGFALASPYRATMLHVEGLASLLEGDAAGADRSFVRAFDAAIDAGVRPFVPVLLAERGIAAIELGDWPAAETLSDEALAIMRDGRLEDYWTSALVFAWSARVALQRNDTEQGRQLVARAARLRPLLSYALPVVSVQTLLEMARSYLALADARGARAVLRQCSGILQQRPSLGVLSSHVAELRATADSIRVGAPGSSSLTTAELRLLPLLRTHLTMREIGERLYLSRNTVKTQAISIYRKLDTSSRSQAITRMHELGLLEHD